jgi:hypothetical protein
MEDIKILLGESASNYSDALINLTYRQTVAELEDYCRRELDIVLDGIAKQITVIKLHRTGSEGIASQSYSGVSESFLNGLPTDMQAIINGKRKLKLL